MDDIATVDDLIRELKKFPGSMEVFTLNHHVEEGEDWDNLVPIQDIRVIGNDEEITYHLALEF